MEMTFAATQQQTDRQKGTIQDSIDFQSHVKSYAKMKRIEIGDVDVSRHVSANLTIKRCTGHNTPMDYHDDHTVVAPIDGASQKTMWHERGMEHAVTSAVDFGFEFTTAKMYSIIRLCRIRNKERDTWKREV